MRRQSERGDDPQQARSVGTNWPVHMVVSMRTRWLTRAARASVVSARECPG
jgi:hypothetical protein